MGHNVKPISWGNSMLDSVGAATTSSQQLSSPCVIVAGSLYSAQHHGGADTPSGDMAIGMQSPVELCVEEPQLQASCKY